MLIVDNLVSIEIFSRYKYNGYDSITNFSTRRLV